MFGNHDRHIVLYTQHGKRKLMGYPIIVRNRRALAYIKDGEICGYVTLEEILDLFCNTSIPEYGDAEYHVDNEKDLYRD